MTNKEKHDENCRSLKLETFEELWDRHFPDNPYQSIGEPTDEEVERIARIMAEDPDCPSMLPMKDALPCDQGIEKIDDAGDTITGSNKQPERVMPDRADLTIRINSAFRAVSKGGKLDDFLKHIPDFDILGGELCFVEKSGKALVGMMIDDRLSMKNLETMFLKNDFKKEEFLDRLQHESSKRAAARWRNEKIGLAFSGAMKMLKNSMTEIGRQIEVERPLASLAQSAMTHDR
jgi:hypothetical protein